MQFEIINKNLNFVSNGKHVTKADLFAEAKKFAGPLWLEPTIGTSTDQKSLMLRFGQEGYPRGEGAAPAVARRWVTLTSIYKALVDLDIEATLQDSRLQKADGDVASSTYVPACALFVNQEVRGKGQGQAQARMSDEDMLMQAMAVDEAKALAIVGNDEKELSMAQRARLRMLIASGAQAQANTVTKTEPKTESVPTSAPPVENPDSEALPF